MKGKKVIVTGGAGFIGSHLVEELVNQGANVTIIDNEFSGKRVNLKEAEEIANNKGLQFEYVNADLRDSVMESIIRTRAPIDYVFHLAAVASVPRSVENPKATFDNNVIGTTNLLMACKGANVGRVIFASSSSVYGDSKENPKEEDKVGMPMSPYALSKYTCEQMMRLAYHLYNIETVSLRYFNVFGPKQDPNSQYAAVIPKFIKMMLAGQRPTVYGDGEQSRDFTYVKNVVDANIFFAKADKEKVCGKPFNVASGASLTVNVLISHLNELLSTNLDPEYLPTRKGDVLHSQANLTNALNLGYSLSVSPKEGLKRTVEYYKEVLK